MPADSNLLFACCLLIGAVPAAAAEDPPSGLPSIPGYQEARAAFEAERVRSGGPQISAQDKAIMARATEDLAAAMPAPGIEVGAKAPDFELPNALGRSVRLADALTAGPVVLTFYRGAWCPYCNLQLRGLHQSLPHFERYGAQLIAVTPQLPDKSLGQVKQDGYPFQILSDLDNSVMQAYGLYFEVPADLSDVYRRSFGLDLAEYNGPGRYLLPVPGTFVIDEAGVVRAAFADVDYKTRMEPAAIVEALRQLHEGG